MEPIEVEGKTVEEAIKKGLAKLKLPKEKVDVKILSDGTKGLFGLGGSKPAKVQLEIKEEKTSNMEELAKNHLLKILQLMHLNQRDITIGTKTIKTSKDRTVLQIDLETSNDVNSALLIGREGKALQSLEVILQAIITHEFIKNKIPMENIPRIILDINRYYSRQTEEIEKQIEKAVNSVRKTKEEFILEPMPARLRRFVHIAIEKEKDLETISEDADEQRRVIINPK